MDPNLRRQPAKRIFLNIFNETYLMQFQFLLKGLILIKTIIRINHLEYALAGLRENLLDPECVMNASFRRLQVLLSTFNPIKPDVYKWSNTSQKSCSMCCKIFNLRLSSFDDTGRY